MIQFSDFKLPEAIDKSIRNQEWTKPTEIQARTIPIALQNQDLIACAQTGSGKTGAYCIPIITRLSENLTATALVLAPTRELAQQIGDVIRDLTSFTPGFTHALIIGGADMSRQVNTLKRHPRIIVATPGRLTDHLHRGYLSLKNTQFLVLDEGDRMLDMGFAPQLNEILKFLPKQRQTMLFSATMPPKVRALAHSYLVKPVSITVGPDSQPVEKIRQKAIECTMENKNIRLMDELNSHKGSVLIFARTQKRTDNIARYLQSYGYSVTALHGGRTQGQRNQALKGFRDGKFRILVATDIASRGIDVPDLPLVVNYDLPMFDEDYVHRIGRTARAGASGEAITLLLPNDRKAWLSLARKFKIKGVDLTERTSRHRRH